MPLVVSTRGGVVENVFYGSIAVVASDGRLLHSAGDFDFVTFTRSTLKAFQALPFVVDGGVEALGLDERELALMTASHSGERFHVETVDRLLEKAGATVSQLRCGCHVPYVFDTLGRRPAPDARFDQRHHNCSGKHAGFLAWCRLHDAPRDGYLSPGHPLQKRIVQTVARLAGLREHELALGVDGCSAPNVAMPLRALARLWAALAAGGADPRSDAALARLFDAMTRYPEYMSGSARSDLVFIAAGQGDWVAKVGADGVQVVGVRSRGLGIALKISDGNSTARYVAATEVLRQLGLVDLARSPLAQYARVPIRNAAGIHTGDFQPVFTLRDAGADS